jgi:squalene-hopene/tetraprenyl-beta-curcumene cyclase
MKVFPICVLAAYVGGSLFGADATVQDAGWSSKAAGGYLDQRMSWWMDWAPAARDHQTFCVSCHTALPYAMARPALRKALAESGPSPQERRFLDNVTKRVRMWNDVAPFYPDAERGVPKTAESRGTEAILNALILARYQSPDAKLALDNMWALQLKTGDAKGAWSWLQFHNAPWEGDSQFYGATLAALAAGSAPSGYLASPDVQERLKLLRAYLAQESGAQVPMNRLMLLWVSTKLPGILTVAQQNTVVEEVLGKQQQDGGFSLSSFVGAWKRHDNTPLETKSDGYATGLVTLVLQQPGIEADQAKVKRGLVWLEQNQNKAEGRWLAYSLNKQRDLSSDIGKFMSDAATAYAVLALEHSK